MAKTYSPPAIPDTPSATIINNMLESRCNHTFENPVKYGIAVYICMVYQAIATIYNTINQKKPAQSHTFWMVSCGIVSTLLIIKCYLIYQILMASAIFIAILLRYGLTALALIGAGLGVAGAVFFDKDGKKTSTPKPSMPSAPPQYGDMGKTE